MNSSRILRGHPAGWALLAAALLIGGYTNLWQGGTSVGATLLVVGYLLFVPLAIMRWIGDESAPSVREVDDTPPYGTAAAVALAALALYVVTLAPTTAMWDTSEYIAVAKVLGIPHPPGNPLFVLIAHTFALLPIPVSYAERVNLLAATTSACSAGIWCLVAHRALRGWAMPKLQRNVAWQSCHGWRCDGSTRLPGRVGVTRCLCLSRICAHWGTRIIRRDFFLCLRSRHCCCFVAHRC